jgi:hypothetical protein
VVAQVRYAIISAQGFAEVYHDIRVNVILGIGRHGLPYHIVGVHFFRRIDLVENVGPGLSLGNIRTGDLPLGEVVRFDLSEAFDDHLRGVMRAFEGKVCHVTYLGVEFLALLRAEPIVFLQSHFVQINPAAAWGYG